MSRFISMKQRKKESNFIMNKKIRKNRSSKGITLIALVITIVVLLILASVTISSLTGENGLLTKASEAKIMTALGAVKEEIELDRTASLIENKNVTVEQLLADGKIKRTVQAEGETYYMYYAIKPEAYEGMQGLGKGTLETLKDVFLIDDEFHVKYIDKSGREYGDNINNKILEDETEIRFASKKFSEYVSRISGVSEAEMKFKWMKNQTSLTISDSSLDSLEDLVFFPNLTKLSISEGVSLKTLDGIENCTKLKSLEFYKSNIGEIKALGNNINLESINIYYAKINDFTGLKMLANLKNVSLRGGKCDLNGFINEINELVKIESLTIGEESRLKSIKTFENFKSNNLKTMQIYNCSLEDVTGIEKFAELTKLSLYHNKINDIESISKLKKLTFLSLDWNNIQDITPLSENIALTDLNLKRNHNIDGNRSNYTEERLAALNKIGEILDRGGNISLDVDKLGLFTNYKKLDLSSQNLENLNCLDGMTELVELDLSNNPITLEDKKSNEILSKMIKLERVTLEQCPNITNISAFNNIETLQTILLRGTNANLKDIEDNISKITIRPDENVFKTIENCDIEKITAIRLDSSVDYSFSNVPNLSKFTNITNLTVPGLKISDYSFISNLKNIQKLNLSGCNLHNKIVDFTELNNLKEIYLDKNYLNSEDIKKLVELKNNSNLIISLNTNSIINASALLEFDSSHIAKIDLRNNGNLTTESKMELKNKFGNKVVF